MHGDDWRTPPAAEPGDNVHTRSLVAAIRALTQPVVDLVAIVTKNDTTRKWIVGLLAANLVGLLGVGLTAAYFINRLADVQTTLVECTTAAPPGKHHPCFERGAAGQAQAIAAIVDTNGNGIPDTQELLANQAAAAKARGLDLPYPQINPPATTTTTAKK